MPSRIASMRSMRARISRAVIGQAASARLARCRSARYGHVVPSDRAAARTSARVGRYDRTRRNPPSQSRPARDPRYAPRREGPSARLSSLIVLIENRRPIPSSTRNRRPIYGPMIRLEISDEERARRSPAICGSTSKAPRPSGRSGPFLRIWSRRRHSPSRTRYLSGQGSQATFSRSGSGGDGNGFSSHSAWSKISGNTAVGEG